MSKIESIKNSDAKYCIERLRDMKIESVEDDTFRDHCLSAVWDEIFKEQPELYTIDESQEIRIKILNPQPNETVANPNVMRVFLGNGEIQDVKVTPIAE